MKPSEPISLKRGVDAVVIPAGNKVALVTGSQVRIQQTLGGSFTVITDRGLMVRIDGKDADALGKEVPKEIKAAAEKGGDLKDQIMAQLRLVFDPEIPVNVVELGLIYECNLKPVKGGTSVDLKMTMTAPGCGMGDVLSADAATKIKTLKDVKDVNIQVVFDPPWNPSMMSEAARLELGMM